MNDFKSMTLPSELKIALERLKFTTATPIQAQTIPLALSGKDIVGSAQTGTGKTLAFSLPTIAHLIENPNHAAIILAPTRELAQQVATCIKQLVSSMQGFNTALLIGGEPIFKQFSQLKAKPKVIIGTPGRVIDHMKRGTLKMNNISFCVLDETDRMFDMGFSIQIEEIISKISTQRQTLMFSATFPPGIEKLAAKYLKSPERIAIGNDISTVTLLQQESMQISESEKFNTLLAEIEKRGGSIIVFASTRGRVDTLAKNLGRDALGIHGEHRQNKRDSTMRSFRQGKIRILVATDVAARGIDVSSVEHVINYDLPQAAEDYLHRVGRTARAGATGSALSFISPSEQHKWRAIQRFMNPGMPEEKFSRDRPARGGRPSSRRKPTDSRYSPQGKTSSFESNKPWFKEKNDRFEDKPKSAFKGKSDRFGDRSKAPANSKFSRFDDKPRAVSGDDRPKIYSRDERPRVSTKTEDGAGNNNRKKFGSNPGSNFKKDDRPRNNEGKKFSFKKKGPKSESRSFAAPKPNRVKSNKPAHSKAKIAN